MCSDLSSDAFERGAQDLRTGRRTLLKATGSGVALSVAAGTALPSAATAARAPRKGRRKRAYVLVIDGCLPGEIDSGLTPNLRALRNQGLHHPRASSMPIMETIPNHVMMMTGKRPNKTGVPANAIYDRRLGEGRTMDRPGDIKVTTIIERMNRRGYRTGTVLSKEYLYGIFGDRATARWEPRPLIPVSDHAPDVFTMRAVFDMIDTVDPHLMFVNLGDIDRVGHTDFTGTNARAARRAALRQTDALIGELVAKLKRSGRWNRSMVMVLADHSMDWSKPDRVVTLAPLFEADPLLRGNVEIADNGGADLLYWTGPKAARRKAAERMAAIARTHPGVFRAELRTNRWLQLGPEAGDVVVFCRAGWRFSDPNPITDNPIPGNHGHLATRSIPFFIGGGHPRVPNRRASTAHARTVDVAPTVASFFGIPFRRRRFDGRARL